MEYRVGRRNHGAAVVRLTPAAEAVLDLGALTRLRAAVGVHSFDEVFEDAIYEVTERLARVEHTAAVGDLFSLERLANDLTALAGRIGMAGVSEIARQLMQCCAEEDMIAARAIAERLIRTGEESLVRAAEMSVEIGVSLEGA